MHKIDVLHSIHGQNLRKVTKCMQRKDSFGFRGEEIGECRRSGCAGDASGRCESRRTPAKRARRGCIQVMRKQAAAGKAGVPGERGIPEVRRGGEARRHGQNAAAAHRMGYPRRLRGHGAPHRAACRCAGLCQGTQRTFP